MILFIIIKIDGKLFRERVQKNKTQSLIISIKIYFGIELNFAQ